ncbi:MAG: hypothetical protein AB1611_09875 [bacterium]
MKNDENTEKKEKIHPLLPAPAGSKVSDSTKTDEALKADKVKNRKSKLPLPAKGASILLCFISPALLFLSCLAAGILSFSYGQNQALHHPALSIALSLSASEATPPRHLSPPRKANVTNLRIIHDQRPSPATETLCQPSPQRGEGEKRCPKLIPLPQKAPSRPVPPAPTSPPQSEDIAITISYPQKSKLTTPYRQIFLEGKIQARHGLRRIEFNGRELFNKAVLDKLIQQSWTTKLDQGGDKASARPTQTSSKLQKTLAGSLENYNLYCLNQVCSLKEGDNKLYLVVEDNAGHKATRRFDICAAPLVPTPHRMILALLPPSPKSGAGKDDDLDDYIHHRLGEAITRQARFHLVERSKLPWLLIEKAIQTSSGGHQSVSDHQREIFRQEITRQIGQLTPAEGILFIEVHKSGDGLEIQGRLVNLESTTLAFHRVFTPIQEPQGDQDFGELDTIISGLAMKFRDSFPLLTGTILAREGSIIEVDLGSEKGVFCGICYNIFTADRQELLCRAIVQEVARDVSRARVIEADMSRKIRAGCRVSTR